MQFQLTTITFALLAALATAAPAELEMRQSGGYYHAVGYKYSGGGCTPTTENNGDPIFGTGGYCQALNRYITPTTPPITSYKLSSLADGCTVKLYTSADCTGTAYTPSVGNCIQANAPFVSEYSSCS